jgi:flagellar basal-body rod protein FlgC
MRGDGPMDFLKSIAIAASGLRAQAGRMRVISENIANADSTAQRPDGDPFRRRIPTFRSAFDRALDARVVSLGKIKSDSSDFRMKYEPGHPNADASGNVKYPNVNPLVEMTDMREAQRSYEANINVIGATRRMIQRTLDILKA